MLSILLDSYVGQIQASATLRKKFIAAAVHCKGEDRSFVLMCGMTQEDAPDFELCWILESGKWKDLAFLFDINEQCWGDMIFTICAIPNGFDVFSGFSHRYNGHTYNMKTNNWTSTPPQFCKTTSEVFCLRAAVCIHHKIYVVGGNDAQQQMLESFDLITKTWTLLPKMLVKNESPIVTSFGHLLFSISSKDHLESKSPRIAMRCYDMFQNNWYLKEPLPGYVLNSNGMATVVMEDCIYTAGEEDKWCLEYRVQTNTWTALLGDLGESLAGRHFNVFCCIL